jgi:hypothetical protein
VRGELDEKLVCVEFHEGKPFSAFTGSDAYDVEFSKRCGGFFCYAGTSIRSVTVLEGDETTLWVADGFPIVDGEGAPLDRNSIGDRLLPALPMDEDGFPIETMDDMARHYDLFEVGGTVYCKVCDDRVPSGIEYECQHIFWHPFWGDYGGCGACEPDYHELHRKELLAFVEVTGCRDALLSALKSRTWEHHHVDAMLWQRIHLYLDGVDYGQQVEHALTEHREATYGGYGWLYSLEPGKTDEDIARTIRWLEASEV